MGQRRWGSSEYLTIQDELSSALLWDTAPPEDVLVVDEELPLSVQQFSTFFYGDQSNFTQTYHEQRGHEGIHFNHI